MAVRLRGSPIRSSHDIDREDGADRSLARIRTHRRAGVARVLAAAAALSAAIALQVGAVMAGGTRGPAVQHDTPVSAMDLVHKPANNSPSLTVDPTDSRFVVQVNRQDAPYGCSMDLSGDGGRSWTTANPITLPAVADSCYAPNIAFDRTGRLYYLFVGLSGAGHTPIGVFLASSTDRARSFSRPRQALGPDRFQVRMALDPTVGRYGRLDLVWLAAGAPPPTGGFAPVPNPIMFAFSDDGGQTFSNPRQVSDPGRTYLDAPSVALGPNHVVHIVYYDLKTDVRDYEGLEGPSWEGTWALVATTSADGGAHFQAGVVVEPAVVPPGRVMLIYTMPPPSVAVDGHDDVFVSWYDNRNGDWDVFLRRSTDGGRHFEGPIRINDDPRGDGIDQYLPALAVASTGRVDAVFYDRRSDPFNAYNDVYYTYSNDQGRHWSRNVKLTIWSSNPSYGPRYTVVSAKGLVEIGARLALASTPSKVLAAWTDTRNEQRGNGAQDIFGTAITFRSSAALRNALQWFAMAFAGLGVLLLGLAAWVVVGVRRHTSQAG